MKLEDAEGIPLDTGRASHYAGGWHAIGTTGADGAVNVELLPGTYTFRFSDQANQSYTLSGATTHIH